MSQYKETLKQQQSLKVNQADLKSTNPKPPLHQSIYPFESHHQPYPYQQVHISKMGNQINAGDFILEEGLKENSYANSNSYISDQEGLKIYKLPSIEYILQEQERKTRSIALMLSKTHKLSDFCENKPSCSSREVLSVKTLDTGIYQLKQLFKQQNIRSKHISTTKNPIFINQPCPENISMRQLQNSNKKPIHFKKQIVDSYNSTYLANFEIDKRKQQYLLELLKQKNRQLQQLSVFVKNFKRLKDARYNWKNSNMSFLKKIIEDMKILK